MLGVYLALALGALTSFLIKRICRDVNRLKKLLNYALSINVYVLVTLVGLSAGSGIRGFLGVVGGTFINRVVVDVVLLVAVPMAVSLLTAIAVLRLGGRL
ncbi:MAG: hypothetical protein RMI83_06440 [Desulfurococcaceae archaeon]|nr:hypothetical protein [Sulfolobales archaeon]MDW8170717.1 hypothetical protein [Desulfurococcaceae archaeon]